MSQINWSLIFCVDILTKQETKYFKMILGHLWKIFSQLDWDYVSGSWENFAKSIQYLETFFPCLTQKFWFWFWEHEFTRRYFRGKKRFISYFGGNLQCHALPNIRLQFIVSKEERCRDSSFQHNNWVNKNQTENDNNATFWWSYKK